jgi:heterodisulfide reductase subunit B
MTDPKMPTPEPFTINQNLARRIQDEIGQNVFLCYQCIKCTSGCPVAEFFDWQPNQIMRALQLGDGQIALHSQTPWLCASCQTCTTRCPQDLNIAAIMDFLTREAIRVGVEPSIPQVNTFNQAFLREVRLWGRSYEPGLMVEMALHNPRALLEDTKLYINMLKKGKVGFFPELTRPNHKVKPIPGANHAVAYYPGCSLHSSATEFDHSTRAVCEALDLNLIEPEGWLCCGASAAHRADPQEALRLPMENLALIEQSGFNEVTMPCAACFNRHKAAQYEIHHSPQHKAAIDEQIGYVYKDQVAITTTVQSLLKHVGTDNISRAVKKPLKDLNVVCYYGCLITRPPQITQYEHPENPTDMDELIQALGAEVHDWSYKTCCCGAAHSLTRPDIVVKLSTSLITNARAAGAEAIVVSCPLCHMNLDARQMQMDIGEPMPILYFSQLMAVALDLPPKAYALNKNLVNPMPLLRQKGFID